MEVSVRPKNIIDISSKIDEQKRYLVNIIGDIGCAKVKSKNAGIKNQSILNAVDVVTEQINQEQNKLEKLSKVLTETALYYQKCEESILDIHNSGLQPIKDKATTEENTKKTSESTSLKGKDFWELFRDEMGEFGVIGSFGKTVGSLIIDGKGTNGFTPYKNIVGLVGKICGVASSETGISWGSLLGIDKTIADKLVDVQNLNSLSRAEQVKLAAIQNWSDKKTDFQFSGSSNVAKNLKVATKWAGTLLSFADNYVKYNKQENKGSTGRVITRAMVDTGADLLLDSAVSTLATAGITAMLGVGAPAVAVGAVTVAATWAINKGLKAATGKDVGEWAVTGIDFVIDNAPKAIDAVVNKVGEGIQNVSSRAESVWNNMKQGVRSIGTRWHPLLLGT